MTTETQPTVEQSLHSIALSLIGIHKELRDTRRIQKDVLRFMKAEMRQPARAWTPRRRTAWDWLRDRMRSLVPA